MKEDSNTDDGLQTASGLRRKAFGGVISLGAKEITIGITSVAGSTLLARLLSPADFGLFAVITFALGFLSAMGNVGVGASLISSSNTPTLQEYRAVFTIEQLIGGAVIAGMWVLSPILARAYQLPPEGIWMFRAVSASMWVSSFRTVSAIQLERHLKIAPLALVETVGVIAYYAIAVGLAWSGWGAWSFVWAVLIRTVLTSGLSLAVKPWRIGWGGLHRAFWRRHLRFGATYQASSMVSLVKDSFTPIIVGVVIGIEAVGYIKWASTLAVYALWVLAGLNRIYFPTFSRLKEFPDALTSFVEKIIWATNALVAPIAVWLLVFIHPITDIVYGSKWTPAIPLFYLFWAANVFVPTCVPIGSLFNALGQPRRILTFAIVWAAGEWGIGLPLVLWLGPIGIAIANLAIQFTNIVLIRMADKQLGAQLWRRAWGGWVLAGLMGIAAEIVISHFPVRSLAALLLSAIVWLGIYAAIWGLRYKKEILQIYAQIRS